MIKKLLTIATVVFTVAVNAQNGKIANLSSTETLPVMISTEKTSVAPGCATLTAFNPSVNVSLYTALSDTQTPGCFPKAGYVFGNNCYGFKEQATFFNSSLYSTVTTPSITMVSVAFYKNTAIGRGTSGTIGTVGLQIYSGTSNAVAPGSAVTSTTATLAQILAAQSPTSTSSLFFYTFTLTPTAIPATGFYASVVLPTNQATGDTAVIYTQTTTAGNNNAWEKDATNAWASITADWGLNVNHVMIPVVCGSNITTSISQNLGLSKDVTIMPNPSTGLVNLAVALAQTENLNVTVTNALGQQIIANKYDGISNELITLDLTNQANGVYFVTVSNGKDKMVQRLILNK